MIRRGLGKSGYVLSTDAENRPLVYNLKIWSPSTGVSLFFNEKEAEQFIRDCLEEFHDYDSDTNEN
jgi:hypothetical protein